MTSTTDGGPAEAGSPCRRWSAAGGPGAAAAAGWEAAGSGPSKAASVVRGPDSGRHRCRSGEGRRASAEVEGALSTPRDCHVTKSGPLSTLSEHAVLPAFLTCNEARHHHHHHHPVHLQCS